MVSRVGIEPAIRLRRTYESYALRADPFYDRLAALDGATELPQKEMVSRVGIEPTTPGL